MRPISLLDLPPEILECILSSLPPADILKMKEISHPFLDFVSSSQYLQHRIDLFSTGLVDNPHVVDSLAERRARLREYMDGWQDPGVPVQCDYPLKSRVSAHNSVSAGQNIFSAHLEDSTAISFIRIPSSTSQGMFKEWTLELPFRSNGHAISPQDNLLAVFECGIGRVVTLNVGHYRTPFVANRQISGSRIALVIGCPNFTMARNYRELVVWDWRTGEVVSKHSRDDPGIGNVVSSITTIHCLEGSWLLALSRRTSGPQLLVLNTLLPQQDPRSWRILQLPPLPRHHHYMIFTRYEDPLEECSGFLVDPLQRVFAVCSQRGLTLAIPVELFVQRMCSVRANSYVPWDEWGEDVITVHLHPDTLLLQLFDTKLLALRGPTSSPGNLGVEIYNLGKSGRRDVQVQQVSEGLAEVTRRVLPTKWLSRRQAGGGIPLDTLFVGNKVIRFFERPSLTNTEYFLRIWKIG
ncbi:hypothetical protein BDM02DRAFT_3128625 [Thelephora ganbajun]|uniref:Uncharacterized protein n=1 Tax=Thelephora ganbajun TaxID=370292 RepID=A0ACB6ZHM2_THEGA|nr:hypothetical protein BDM02DRAFT_3128625 [Thelephora ganbajun]